MSGSVHGRITLQSDIERRKNVAFDFYAFLNRSIYVDDDSFWVLFIAAVVFYWLVAKPLAELPTYEELKAAEELAKK